MKLIFANNAAKRHQIRYHPFIPRHLCSILPYGFYIKKDL